MRAESTRAHLRGSNLLLVGRMFSLAANLLVNVLLVRYLAKGDYGALAYALAIGAAGANLLLLGMPRAVGRFAPLYQERGEHGALFGALLGSTALVSGLGLAGLGLVLATPDVWAARVHSPLAVQLTTVLFALAPLQALDRLFQSMLTVFAGARELFLRRYLLGPLLRLGAVALVIAASGGARAMAWAYLGASILGVLVYGPLLLRALRSCGLLEQMSFARLRLPWRDLLGFGLPLVVADVMVAVRAPIAVVLLEALRGTDDVADLSAFLKIAGLNLIVLESMKQLFLPVATRLLARGAHGAIDELYWQTTIWISLLSFPVFAACIAMPETIAWVVNGPAYVDASAVLVVLAIGEYANAALGLNTYTLHVYARVRFLVWTTSLATLCGMVAAGLLIPAHGALGAAAGLSTALVLQNALHHRGLAAHTQVVLLRWRYLGVYASQLAALLALLAVEAAIDPPAAVSAACVAAAAFALVRVHRRTMGLAGVLPELGRLPILGRVLLAGATTGRGVAPQRGSLP